jgi:N6-L-threonylcarbamoyladenine synthase
MAEVLRAGARKRKAFQGDLGGTRMAADGLTVLGIETSCDETAVGVVTAGPEILADVVLSQVEAHRPFGGIVPEIAARAHVEHLDRSIAQALEEAGVDFAALDGIAATAGPGLIGGLLVGLATAKAIAAATAKPLIAVNHLEGHALTARLVAELDFPYLLALLSGGHCQLLIVEGVGRYHRLGTTIDDAVGEAFDKTAKLLGLGYPGGPALERAAVRGDGTAHALPRPMKGRAGCDFSFSGLKTAVRHLVQEAREIEVEDVAASFQAAVADVLADRTRNAIAAARELRPEIGALVVAGGVAANKQLRARLDSVAGEAGLALVAPPPRLCTDNGAMIAWAGLERLRLGLVDRLDFKARARWPLDPEAPPAPFAGVKA